MAKELTASELSVLSIYERTGSIRKAADEASINYSTARSFISRMRNDGVLSQTGRVDWTALGVEAPAALVEVQVDPPAEPVLAEPVAAEFTTDEIRAIHQVATRELAREQAEMPGQEWCMVTIRAPQRMRDELKAKAERVGSGVGEIVRGLIQGWIDGDGKVR